MPSVQPTGQTATTADPVDPAVAALNTKIATDLENRIKTNDKQKKDLNAEWRRNVELRLGRKGPLLSISSDLEAEDDSQSAINPDWFLTKTKLATHIE